MAKRFCTISAIALTLGFAPCAWSLPTTAPSETSPQDISSLIQQLDDDDFSVRESAGEKLLEIGPPARDALEQAARSDDPEERTRAESLLKRLDTPEFPGVAPAGLADDQQFSIQVDQNNAGSVEVTDHGRTIHIDQDESGIHMTVSGYLNGKPVTARYDAPDAEALRAKSPEAYQQWEQWHAGNGAVTIARNNGQQVVIVGGRLIVNNANGVPAADQSDNLTKLKADITAQMARSKLSDDKKSEILGQIETVSISHDEVMLNPARQQAYLDACDKLRQLLADSKLPDPGPAIPPPAGVRLGVSVGFDPIALNGGVSIGAVTPGSRGDKLGLLPDDVVRSANGKPISNVTDLRVATMANKHLTLTIIRGGQQLTLQEPGDKPAAPAAAGN
ncbi:MAG: PDZ domain-containing protein [Tepidisphaeraceae bacterium]|jgi:hypothetical protein